MIEKEQKLSAILIVFFAVIIITSCTKKDVISSSVKAENYYPVLQSKVWVYRLDSTAIPDFGASLVVHSYHVKDSVASSFFDNTNRLSWIVYRFITDTLEQTPWQSLSTYYITPTATNIEVLDDNNLRFIKLVTPVVKNKTWQGNSYIDTRSINSQYQYLDGWNYTYTSVDSPFTALAGIMDSTVTILQQDETSPEGAFNPDYFQQRDYSIEVYAKGIGLVYKDFLHWIWQPDPQPGAYQDGSYGIRLNLIRTK